MLVLRDRSLRDCERVRREKEALEEEMTSTIQAFQQQIAGKGASHSPRLTTHTHRGMQMSGEARRAGGVSHG